MRTLAVLGLAACFVESAFATPQAPDTLRFGGREYAIQEIPMLGVWDYGGGGVGAGKQKSPNFDAQGSGNWAGYRAQFEIRNSKLYLRRIVGFIDGKKRENEAILVGMRFPLVATWYTGKIHLEVGDFDYDSQTAHAVIIFHIEKGLVTKMEFAERMKRVQTWNGLPANGAETNAKTR